MIRFLDGWLVKHSQYFGPDWHNWMWVWHSNKNWRVGWIIFGYSYSRDRLPGQSKHRLIWPHPSRNL